jgi:hypothetical protein
MLVEELNWFVVGGGLFDDNFLATYVIYSVEWEDDFSLLNEKGV